MFWVVPDDVSVLDTFKFDIYFSHDNEYDRKINHVFLNGDHYDGVMLMSKHRPISEREFNSRFLVDKKEWNLLVSKPKPFDVFYINNYEEYIKAAESSTTNMFWAVWGDIEVKSDFKFDYQVPKYNQHLVHVFKNKDYYDGVCLMPKKTIYSKKEIDFRFFTDKKEVDIVASTPKKYDIFYINTYEEYQEAVNVSKTNMFWAVWGDIEPRSDFKFDYQVPKYNQHLVHVFKNKDYYDGISLIPTKNIYSRKEIEFRFFADKKEVDIDASMPKSFDIVFISYKEPNADENFAVLKSKYPAAKRVHGVTGIHNAHKKAAALSGTKMFWVVDGDAQIVDDFKFEHQVASWDQNTVHVWRSRNPINNLEYGYGGVKLLPTDLTLKLDPSTVDMTTSISDKFKLVEAVSNLTAFNTDAFSTWKSAFRECVKLASKKINRQVNEETEQRLDTWCTQGADKLFGEYAIAGALAGKAFALENPTEVHKINDFDWLYETFKSQTFR